MNIGIIVFAYNRSQHLKKVLEGLKRNEGVSKLYIFQDGLKYEQHREEWEKTQQVIKAIDWCEVAYHQSTYNKGLAKSIVDGINIVFENNDAVVVLEDDCVPIDNFISFMRQCFEKYQDNKKVYSVSGYSWPINLPEDEYDVYGCGRISSWGWGTWKDRWEQYGTDNNILTRLKEDQEKSRYFAAWGSDCEQTLLDRIAGVNDSWAVYWALIVIENKGICVNPYKSLIHNIGFDGTGVHCGLTDRFEVQLENGQKVGFKLPNDLDMLHTTEYAFADLYGNYTATSEKDEGKQNVLVYGLGNFFKKYERDINNDFNIVAFIDQKKKGWYAGKKIIKLRDAKDFAFDRIIIMVKSIQECIKIAKEMLNDGIEYKSIILGYSRYGIYSKTIDEMSIVNDGRIYLKFDDASIIVESEDEFNNVYEIFADQIYSYSVNNAKRDIVINVGMNIGGSALYFAEQKNVDRVYGYEPFRKTFIKAENNLRYYLDIGKINAFQYGISSENEIRFVSLNVDKQAEQIEMRKASEVFEPIFNEYPHHNIILKMDCAGEEYKILEELMQSGILEKFKFIMLEWHCKGKERFLDCLKNAGFSWWCSKKNTKMGLVYAYQCK